MLGTLVGLAAQAGVVLVLLTAVAGPASAHAELESTTPSAGVALAVAPARIELRFSEHIRVASGGVRLIDESGSRIDRTDPVVEKGVPDVVALRVPQLHDGAYVVSWRVVSADGHPVRGAFTFRVGSTGNQQAVASLAERLLSGSRGRTDVGAVYAVIRALTFAAMLVLLGLASYVLFVRSETETANVESEVRLRRIVRSAGTIAVLAGLAAVLVYGPYASGRSFGALNDGTLLDDTLHDRVGRSLLLRTVALAVVAYLVHEVSLRASAGLRRIDRVLLAAFVGGTLVAETGTGHGAVGRWTAASVVATVGHVAAAGAWIGGLFVVFFAVLGAHTLPASAVHAAMQRYSRVAFVSVIVIVGTGVLEAMRQVGSIDALTTTTYGRLLMVKTAAVAGVVALGGLNRRWLRSGEGALTPLRRRMGFETLGSIAIVAATSLLVNAAPARESVIRPVSETLRAQTVLIDVTFDPARKGLNEIHLYALTKAGLPQKVIAITATMELPSAGVEPISLQLLRAGPNHFQALGADLPVGGTWRIAVQVQLDEFTEQSAAGVVRIR